MAIPEKLTGKQQYQAMNEKVLTPSKVMADTLDQCRDQLRDAYMNFSDLEERCRIRMDEKTPTDEPSVFYFKPETFLLQDPESQRQYRDNLLKKISGCPKPEPITYLGDEIHRNFNQTVSNRSTPTRTKQTLHEYFLRRQYSLQHLKYKLLVRWAHHTLNQEITEMIGTEATFMYGKLEYNLEQAIKRCERLDQDDFIKEAVPTNRPSTRSGEGQGALYVENFDLDPQSLIREDDVEVYIRGISYRNKINKLVNKFISRLKWLPLEKRYDIFEKAVNMSQDVKKQNISKQKYFIEEVVRVTRENTIMQPDQEHELKEIKLRNYYYVYPELFLNNIDKIKHSWKANHDIVPELVADRFSLQIQILSRSEIFNLKGDINMDHGYSFSYQIISFFPVYFQRQVIKSQFSIYDLFAHEDDKNQVQKRTLSNIARIDTNIFRDIISAKGQVPSDEAIGLELRNSDIKVIRLKNAAYWIQYIILIPNEPDWHKKQQAILSHDNPIDQLFKAGMNFLDVNDLATVNRINEDNSTLHQQNLKKLLKNNPHNHVKDIKVKTQDGDKTIKVDQMDFKNSINLSANIEAHLLRGVQDPGFQDETVQVASNAQVSSKSLRFCPQHLLTALYTLRFIHSRDCKTKLQYTLNYFRSIQKRLAIDLREFGTRERMDAHMQDPLIHSKEANAQVTASAQRSVGIWVKQDRNTAQEADFSEPLKNLTVFDEKAIEGMKNMASLRGYKQNGMFNNKIFSTCPGFPKFHDTFGEPKTVVPDCDEQDKKDEGKNISSKAIKFMGRIDHVELNELTEEVYVKDDFGIYIMYDCVFQDMQSLEGEICKIASFYLNKSEILLDPSIRNQETCISKDRLEVLDEILSLESQFNFKKVKLMQVYMECYEHITDPLEQQRLMQVLTDIAARRPRLNLSANYFKDSYTSELKCLDKQFELMKVIVDTQISMEKTENRRMQESINLSYKIANQFEKNQWKYQDAQVLLEMVIKNKQKRDEELRRESRLNQELEKDRQALLEKQKRKLEQQECFGLKENNHLTGSLKQSGLEQVAQEIPVDDDNNSEFDEAKYFETDENQFTALLGLPQISIETIYANYKEKDNSILELMNENANFVTTYEGYPELLTNLIKKSIKNNTLFKPNNWSQETGALDFYDSLDFATRLYAMLNNAQQELYDALKPHDSSFMTNIDTILAEQALENYRNVIQIMEGAVVEYQGRERVENEQIIGNSEKQIFYAKEMIADLTHKPKAQVDPFLIAKIDIQSINYFDFPKTPQEQNKYTLREKGFSGFAYIKECEKLSVAGIGKSKVKKDNTLASNLQKNTDMMSRRNINVPCMLELYCNLVELHRLRNEIILSASETTVLRRIYQEQQEVANCKNFKVDLNEGISFVSIGIHDGDQKLINFVDDGPSHQIKFDLAIKEFDPALLSNFDFLNPDTLKLNILTSGLEEVRGILQYQLFQKYLLITAIRTNQIVLENHQRALSELSLLKNMSAECCYSLPNPFVNLNDILSRQMDGVDQLKLKEVTYLYKQNLSQYFAPVFYNVQQKKSQSRTSIAQEFNQYQNLCSSTFVANQYCTLRVMRTFKLKLLTKYIQTLMNEICLDAQKIQVLTSCNRLRHFNRYFNFNPSDLGLNGEPPFVFKYETHQLIENFPSHYYPTQFNEENTPTVNYKEKDNAEIKAINVSDLEIIDFRVIPSSFTILTCATNEQQQINEFRQRKDQIQAKQLSKFSSDLKQIQVDLNNPEKHLRAMLPTFTPTNGDIVNKKNKQEALNKVDEKDVPKFIPKIATLDYEEALYFSDSKYSKLVNFYLGIERIITMEWFINKLQFKNKEVCYLDQAIESGLPFFKVDDQEQRTKTNISENMKKVDVNLRAQQFCYEKIVNIHQKKTIAEELTNFSQIVKSFLNEYSRTKADLRDDYLKNYTDFRYLQIVGSLHKLVQQFYYQKKLTCVKDVQSVISGLTKMDHVRVKCMSKGNYNVNTQLVHPQMQNLESSSLIFGSVQYEQIYNFRRCIQPILNEKALEPPQITMFQSIYQNDSLRRTMVSQFVGQTCSTIYNPFQALDTALLNMSPEDRLYCQSFIVQTKYQANDFMETVYNDVSMASLTNEDVYSLGQLRDAIEFMQQNTRALLLKNAAMCWSENSVLPNSFEVYDRFEQNFRSKFFWKILEQKREIMQKWSSQFGNSVPSSKDIKELKEKIDNMQDDQTLATKGAEEKRDAMVKALKAEFNAMKKKVTLDTWFTTRAEIELFSNEIEKFLMQASIGALDSECAALAKCFTVCVPQIQMHIHPFQQFAATFFDKVDPNFHLDVSNKISAVQILLTRLKNRGTAVETLTSGPGMVFTIKDINECLLDFCRSIVTYSEKELKSRSALHHAQYAHIQDTMYMKDQKIAWLEHRLQQIGVNLENIIDAKLFEKGNSLIYELDHTNRVLTLFKQNFFSLESTLQQKIQGEQAHKFKRNQNIIEQKQSQFVEYLNHIKTEVNSDFAAEIERIKEELKYKVMVAKNSGPDSQYKSPIFYPANGSHVYTGTAPSPNNGKKSSLKKQNPFYNNVLNESSDGRPIVLPGAVVPKGFSHYSHCICYVPDAKHPKPTLEMAELEILSEKEARSELARMCVLVRKQRILWRTKEMCQQQKYQDKINLLTKQQSNNTYLWEQMAEGQKRERVMQQELKFTQQSLAAAEKVICKLKEEIRDVEADRSRLTKYKMSKKERLKELEDQVKKIELFDNIDTDKLLIALTKKDKQIQHLQHSQKNFDFRLEYAEQRRFQDVNQIKSRFNQEQKKTQQIVDKMDQMKLELKMLESNDSSVTSIWKKKCMDIFEVCQTMKQENDDLRERCKELIDQGIHLAEAIGDYQNSKSIAIDEDSLQNVGSKRSQRLASQQYKSQVTPMTQGRQMVSTAGTFIVDQDTPMQHHPKANQPHNPNSAMKIIMKSGQGQADNWGVQSPNSFNLKQPNLAPLTAQHQRGRSIGAAGAQMLGIPDTKSRQKNDIKGILTGNSQSFNSTFEKSVLFKPSQPFSTTNQKDFASNFNAEDSKLADKMQELKAAHSRKKNQDSMFNSTGKPHFNSQHT